jgi:hypothetical protein
MPQVEQNHPEVARRRRRSVGAAAVAACLLAGGLLTATQVGASPRPGHVGPAKRHGLGLASPDAAAVYGNDLFVANKGGNSVTELNATSGNFIRTISGTRYRFNQPTALQVIGKDLFVANASAGVTEVAISSGALVRLYRGPAFFSDPVALTASGSSLFVLNARAGTVTKIETATTTGRMMVRRFSFKGPKAIVAAGPHLFVTNSTGNYVTEITSATLKALAILRSKYQFDEPTGIAAHNGDVWVANYGGQSLTELLASTGAFVQAVRSDESYLPDPGPLTYGDGYFFTASPPGGSPMITQVPVSNPSSLPWMMCNTNGPYHFSNPEALVVAGANLWVVNQSGASAPYASSLTEMRAGSGDLVQTIS